jgi:hypothetical protein
MRRVQNLNLGRFVSTWNNNSASFSCHWQCQDKPFGFWCDSVDDDGLILQVGLTKKHLLALRNNPSVF